MNVSPIGDNFAPTKAIKMKLLRAVVLLVLALVFLLVMRCRREEYRKPSRNWMEYGTN